MQPLRSNSHHTVHNWFSLLCNKTWLYSWRSCQSVSSFFSHPTSSTEPRQRGQRPCRCSTNHLILTLGLTQVAMCPTHQLIDGLNFFIERYFHHSMSMLYEFSHKAVCLRLVHC